MHAVTAASLLSAAYGNRKQWVIVKILGAWEKYGLPATGHKNWRNTNVVNKKKNVFHLVVKSQRA